MRLEVKDINLTSCDSNLTKEILPEDLTKDFKKDLEDGEDVTDVSILTLIERDRVREYLEKNPSHRTEKDIQFLLDFMQHMPAFSNMTMSMKRSLCRVMVFALVEKAGTVVLRDGEQLDSWSVILNGHVEVARPDGTIQHLHMGDSFGVSTTTRDVTLQEGVMTTKSDDCQFVCIPQEDFYDILLKEKENIIKIQDATGEVVMVMEKRECEERGNFSQGRVVLRATPDMLIKQLMDDNTMDETYTTDFLLTYRTFMKSPVELADYLLLCLQSHNIDKAIHVMHVWVLNHFVDFETNMELFYKLERFFEILKVKDMQVQIKHLQQTCSERARTRQVLFVLKNDEEPLQFILVGGQEKTSRIFVSHVDEKSPASKAGIRVADQIISVNNHNLEGISLEKAYEFLQMTNHLMLTVKSNLLDFEKLRMKTSSLRDYTTTSLTSINHQPPCTTTTTTTKMKQQTSSDSSNRGHLHPRDPGGSTSSIDSTSSPLRCVRRMDQSPPASKIRQALGRMNLMQKSETCENYTGFRNSISSTSEILDSSNSWNNISWNQSIDLHNPSRSSAIFSPSSRLSDNSRSSAIISSDFFPHEEVSAIAIFRADQTSKHILIKKSTTVQEVIESVIGEFEISDPPNNYSLCQITLAEDGTIKTKHLPNHISDLAERCTLNSRYYLRDIRRLEKLITSDLNAVLSTEVNFLQVPFSEVASQLTQRDMQLFCSIDPIEYVNDLFEISNVPQLTRFSELVNEEMFWVVTEVCNEQNCLKRSKILKQFIKIAERCHKLKNFNSMFAILSGLGHGSVSRLRQTWEKLPDKYNKLFEEMQGVMDPSRNMLKYRNLLHSSQPPMIPFFPLVKKDLTFIHFGNDSRMEGLINFDKLRMISKEIRLIYRMACVSNTDKLNPLKNSIESLASTGSNSSLVSATPSKKFNSAFPNPLNANTTVNAKKVYEESQTSRTVKTYIANLKIISDESKLSAMSLVCEPNGKSSRKSTSSSTCNVSRPVVNFEITGPRFGSENQTAVLKLISLSEAVKPINNGSKNNSQNLTNSKRGDKIKTRLSPKHLSMESSSVSNIRLRNKRINPVDPFKVITIKKISNRLSRLASSPSHSLHSLHSSSSSSSNDIKTLSASNVKAVMTPPPSMPQTTSQADNASSSSSSHVTSIADNASSSSSSHVTSIADNASSSSSSHVTSIADNASSSTSSGIYSLESASSFLDHHHQRHHHHQQQQRHHHHDFCCDVDIANQLDNLPDIGVDDDDDDDEEEEENEDEIIGDDYDDDDDDEDYPINGNLSCVDNEPVAKDHGSNRTLHQSDSSIPIIQHHFIIRDPTSHMTGAKSLTGAKLFDSKSFDATKDNSSSISLNKSRSSQSNQTKDFKQQFNCEEERNGNHDDHHHHHHHYPSNVQSSSSPSPNLFLPDLSPSTKNNLPSYEKLLSMKQDVPSKRCCKKLHNMGPNLMSSNPIPSHQQLPQCTVELHSKCCCCSSCFQSSYHNHHSHQRSPQKHALVSDNNNKSIDVVSVMTSTNSSIQQQQQQRCVANCFSNGNHQHSHHRYYFTSSSMPTNHVPHRSPGPVDWLYSATNYHPYATVHDDDVNELVTLV